MLRFDPVDARGSPGTRHFDLSGFELEQTAVPEPTALLLIGVGLSALVGRAFLRPR